MNFTVWLERKTEEGSIGMVEHYGYDSLEDALNLCAHPLRAALPAEWTIHVLENDSYTALEPANHKVVFTL